MTIINRLEGMIVCYCFIAQLLRINVHNINNIKVGHQIQITAPIHMHAVSILLMLSFALAKRKSFDFRSDFS